MRLALYSKGTQRLVDGVVCAIAWAAAYQMRFDGSIPELAYRQMLLLILPFAAGQVGINQLLGIYRYQWRYISAEDALYILRAYMILPATLLCIRLVFGSSFALLRIRLGVIAISFVLALGGALVVRLSRRLLYQRSSEQGSAVSKVGGIRRRYLLVGAGAHGAMVAREMLIRKGIEVVGFVDDDPGKQGALIGGIPVLGCTSDVSEIVASRKVDEILVCISPKSRDLLNMKELAKGNNGSTVPSRIVPTLQELLETGDTISVLPETKRLNQRDAGKPQSHPDGQVTLKATWPDDTIPLAGGDFASQGPHVIASPSPSQSLVQNKTILITGGAGFIGSTLAEKLAERNRLILLDQAFAQAPIRFTQLLKQPNVEIVQGNILELPLRSVLKDADVVIHAAAILGVNRVCTAARETLETNYVGTSRLLKALDVNPRIERFIYFSTSEVFGVNSYRVNEASRPIIGPIAESRWSYAMSKLAGEHLVASYFRETRLPTVIVRPFNIFGPRRTGDYALGRFIISALKGEPLEVHGDGTQIRSWCYIEDFCSALLKMVTRPEAIGEDFNIGNPGNTLTIYELARKVIQLAGSSSEIVFRESTIPDISIRVPSLDKAKRSLGYEPLFDLNTALKLTIQWHRENLPAIQGNTILPLAVRAAHTPNAA